MTSMMKNWLPQDCVLVRFRDDRTLLHWRMVLHCVEGDRCYVTTPDREVQVTTLAIGDTYEEIRRMKEGRLPTGVRDRETYLPRHSAEGELGNDETRRLVEIALRQTDFENGRRRLVGRSDAPAGENAARKAASAKEEPDGWGDGDMRYFVVFSTEGSSIGEERQPGRSAQNVVIGGRSYSLFHEDGNDYICRGVDSGSFKSVRDSLQLGAKKAAEDEQDLRVLPVLFDTAEERWRTVAEAVPDFTDVDFEDFPLQGPRTIGHDTRQLRRLNLDFTQHHESWLKKSGVRASDRSVHEHSAICRTLNLMMCYDQLNLCGLASAEALNRRRSLIEHAHQGRPDAPSYEGAEDFLGVREAADGSIMDPALTSHVAKKQATRAEIMKQTRLAAEEKRLSKKGDGKGKNKEDASGSPPTKP